MKVTVVGLGLIGGSISLDIKRKNFATEVIGVEASPKHADQALRLSLVDRLDHLASAVPQSDLVIVAVPVGATKELLPKVLDFATEKTTVTDVGSTKEQIAIAVASHPKRAQYVGSHPMAGTENSGPTAALQGLFTGKTAVICDPWKSEREHLDKVRALYAALEMRLVEMSSSEHDVHVAFVSHLSHISSFVLANTVLEKEKNINTIFDLAGGGFESTVRLAKSSPDMWAPIFDQNRQNILSALDSYIKHIYKFREALASLESKDSRTLMENANQIRRVLAKKEPKNVK
jgi:prephenate dehydrogenase